MRRPWYNKAYVIILFFVVGAALATSSLLLLLIPQTDEIIRLAVWRTLGAASFQLELNAQYHGWREGATADGLAERERRDLTLDVGGRHGSSAGATQSSLAFRWQSGEPNAAGGYEAAGEYRRAGGISLARLTKLPDDLLGLDLSPFRDRWYELDLEEILRAVKLPVIGGAQGLDELDRAFLIGELRRTPLLVVTEKLRDERLHDVTAHHYKVRPELLYVRTLLIAAEERRLDRPLTARERTAWDTFFAAARAADGEIWIGAGDYYVHRLRLAFAYDDGTEQGTLTVTLDLSRFNEPFAVETSGAEGAQDAAPYVESLLAGLVAHLPTADIAPGTRPGARPASGLGDLLEAPGGGDDGDPDHDGLSDLLEAFYRADRLNPDTDGDGRRDGYEIDTGWSPTGPHRLFDFTGGRFGD
jgi:hypothetical protein